MAGFTTLSSISDEIAELDSGNISTASIERDIWNDIIDWTKDLSSQTLVKDGSNPFTGDWTLDGSSSFNITNVKDADAENDGLPMSQVEDVFDSLIADIPFSGFPDTDLTSRCTWFYGSSTLRAGNIDISDVIGQNHALLFLRIDYAETSYDNIKIACQASNYSSVGVTYDIPQQTFASITYTSNEDTTGTYLLGRTTVAGKTSLHFSSPTNPDDGDNWSIEKVTLKGYLITNSMR